jgi:Cu-Zn family superoxide dismutase
MKKTIFYSSVVFILPLLLFAFVACNNSNNNNDQVKEATATLTGTQPDTTVSGMAQFTANGDKVQLNLHLTIPSMPNQVVAVHIHDNGNCGEMAMAAGGHWNPTNEMHGKWGSGNYHSGDIGNVSLDADGNGSLQMETDRWSIGGDAKTNVLNHSIVIHNGADDFTSQPSGNSGQRIGCGVIRQVNQH